MSKENLNKKQKVVAEKKSDNQPLFLKVEIPGVGEQLEFTAVPNMDPDYPGVNIQINNLLAVIVEYDKAKNQVVIHSYDNDSDEPTSTVVYKKPYTQESEK